MKANELRQPIIVFFGITDHFPELRNDPTLDYLSHMSPYLHFGQISPLFIALKVKEIKSPGTEAFLEELIIRRELSMNFVFYNAKYDSFEGIPEWSKKTLRTHQKDKCQSLYSLEELESTSQNIVEGIPPHSERPFTLFSTSAVGYYGFCGDEELVEDSPPGNDFLARMAVEWEGEALKAKNKGARVVITRFGIVMGEKRGALSQMIPLFKKYIGGPIGSGKQWFSWVHIKDLAEAFAFLLKRPEISGPVNVCSPNPVRNKDLAKAIGRALHKPSFIPAPGFMVKWVLGEFGSVILEGQKVIPRKLLESGFIFQYPGIEKALQEIAKS